MAGGEDAPEFMMLITYLYTKVLNGRNAHLTNGLRCALGREPRDFSDYARDTAAAGDWNGGVLLGTSGSLG
ncbi:MAG: hypothetical protein M3283_03570 [Actinomycetota bacterium]|nr:hypothetical protein [Actinomycetota bacterium]